MEELNHNLNSDPSNWKFGVFYVNKSDKRIIIPKRHQVLGLTLNLGNPKSYVLLTLLIILITVSIVISKH